MSFGGGKSKSSSSNKAFDFLKGAYGGQINTGVGASNALAGLLGVGGDPAASQGAFQNYLNSAGYKFQLGEGQNAIASSNAASGLLNSGSALKRLTSYGQGLASNYLQQYMAQLGGLSQQGLGAGSLIGQAGQTSNSSSKQFNFGF
jgi:hypothetical protein